jgi:ABC-type siderophore export system fused ATPase/permease subunit
VLLALLAAVLLALLAAVLLALLAAVLLALLAVLFVATFLAPNLLVVVVFDAFFVLMFSRDFATVLIKIIIGGTHSLSQKKNCVNKNSKNLFTDIYI